MKLTTQSQPGDILEYVMDAVKTCTKCSEEKPLSQFDKAKGGRGGRRGDCKTCTKRKRGEFLARHGKRLREQGRAAYKTSDAQACRETPEARRRQTARVKKYSTKHPERSSARNAVNNAIRGGRLTRQPCENCGTTNNVHGHHDDYSKPLDVRWLCREHHVEFHRKALT